MLKIILALVASMLVYSCTKDNNPLTSGQVSDYIGEAGTQRTYKTTERWLVPGTDQPYYTVPDSLMSSVSLDTNQLRSGLCIIENCVEAVSSITDDYYTSYDPPLENPICKLAQRQTERFTRYRMKSKPSPRGDRTPQLDGDLEKTYSGTLPMQS